MQLQVAEDARAQFGLPAGAFQLLHRRRALDPALPFRLSGVPNNAALELQPLAAGGQQVRVCVQQADGKRVQAVVAADATLASMLEGFQLLPARDEVRLRVCVCVCEDSYRRDGADEWENGRMIASSRSASCNRRSRPTRSLAPRCKVR